MQHHHLPLAVRLIGFSEHEADLFVATFAVERGRRHDYFCLTPGNLQDPDLYLVNADDLKALATLSALGTGDARPALVVGAPLVMLPHICVERPIRWRKLFDALDGLGDKRVQALSRLDASHIVVPERRRGTRLDLDLTDPTDYQRIRAAVPSEARLLIVDRNFALRDHMTELSGRHPMSVDWLSDARFAVEHCQCWRISLVLINTATLESDPYQLCKSIKQSRAFQHRTAVIFLAEQSFIYNLLEGQRAECDGFLNHPLTDHVLRTMLQKFLPLAN